MFAGVDAGTKSYRVVCIDKSYSETIEIPTAKVRKNPKVLVKTLEELNADVYAGLSGYGLPVKHFSELNDFDVFLMTLTLEREQSVGLRKAISMISSSDLNFYTIPAVIHMQTVPEHRKLFKIDMGTYDKLCTAIAVSHSIKCERMVVAEVGYGYTSFIALKDGKVVDGIGGSSFLPGFGSSGCIDAEVAYLLGDFPKSFTGIGLKDLLEEELATNALAENVLKGIKAIEVSVGKADKVVLSGRMADKVAAKVASRAEVEVYGRGKFASALGAAMVAMAIAKPESKVGRFVRDFGIFSAKGTVLDYLPERYRQRIIERFKHSRTHETS